MLGSATMTYSQQGFSFIVQKKAVTLQPKQQVQ
jgi:hypothetical protein